MTETTVNLADPASFDHWVEDAIRFGDMDATNHVNNVAFLMWVEDGRAPFMRLPGLPAYTDRSRFIVGNVAMRYRRQAHWPGRVRIGSRVLRVGRTSMLLATSLFVDDACVGTAETTMIYIEDGKSVPISDAVRARLVELGGSTEPAPLPEPPPVPLTDPASFPHWVEDNVRFGDMDSTGHVNNISIARYVESGRVPFMRGPDMPLFTPRQRFVVGAVSIRYRAQAFWPGAIRIGTRVLRLGNTSVTTGHGVFIDGTCIATAETVMVFIIEGRPAPLPDDARPVIAAMLP
ncbi:MAG: thioesterase family protein [Pseudomonadota bacterium]|nr:thioesterase family protein [Pseudomonadota bacterium]